MIADDNPNILEELLEIVDWEDFSVEIVGTYANGATLLEAVEEKKPDIVLSDISMPRLGGIELAAQLREVAPKVKVILISCFSEFDYARKAIELGVCGYIIKPIQPKNLTEVMEKVIHQLARERIYLQEVLHRDTMLSMARQNIWLQLLLSGGEESTITANLEMLQFPVPEQPVLHVARIRFYNSEEIQDLPVQTKELRLLITQFLESWDGVYLVQPDQESLALVSLSETRENEHLMTQLSQLCIDVEAQLKKKIKIGLSSCGDRFEQLPQLHEQAFLASRRRYGRLQPITPYEETDGLVDLDLSAEKTVTPEDLQGEQQQALPEQHYSKTVAGIKDYIEANYMKNITTGDVAHSVYLSPGYANICFRKECGMSICDYILWCRVERAKQLLAETSESVAEIAEQVGYGSKANFYIAFKRLTEMSPTDYRNSRMK